MIQSLSNLKTTTKALILIPKVALELLKNKLIYFKIMKLSVSHK